jgi:dihydroflavonol-4-reductase
MRIFLTGGTGYLGGAIARRLVAEGHELHCLVRESSGTAALEAIGARLHVGDIAERFSMRQGMAGSDWVIHAAADLDLLGPPGRMERVNVQGSENVASLAFKLGTGRFLSISSMAYWGGTPDDGSPGDETMPLREPPTRYSATKRAGQQAIDAWAERGLRVNTVFPSVVYGPPGKHGGVNGLIRALAQRRFPLLVGGDRRSSWLYVDDLVEGVWQVMQHAEPGRHYLLGGDVASSREIAHRVSALAGVKPPRGNLSPRLLRWVSAAFPFILPRRLAREQLRSLERHWVLDDSRARAELDWRPRSLAEGLPGTVEYLLEVASSESPRPSAPRSE